MATISGMKTTYDTRKEFTQNLQTLFEKIEDLNRPAPMTEGEYLEFANLIKELHGFAGAFTTDNPVWNSLVESVGRPARQAPVLCADKADNKLWLFCDRCNVFGKRKNKAKHLRSEKCMNIFNSIKMATQITKMDKHNINKFAKTTNHPFYKIGSILQRDFLIKRTYNEERVVAWDEFRLAVTVAEQVEVEVAPQVEVELKKTIKRKNVKKVKPVLVIEEEEPERECCSLIVCCCEADKLQVIADNERKKAEGYIEINGKWIKPEPEPIMWKGVEVKQGAYKIIRKNVSQKDMKNDICSFLNRELNKPAPKKTENPNPRELYNYIC